MPAITNRLPLPLSSRIASATQSLFSRQGREFDIALGGIPFMLATSQELPRSVQTIPVRKDQFDAESDPGEQSLSSWWRRSQSSFHGGAGDLYQENSESNIDSTTFNTSSGIDVFTPGQITLLKRMGVWTDGAPAVASRVRTYSANGVRTNLVLNPSAEVDLTEIVPVGADAPTLTRDATKAAVGDACVRIDWNDSASNLNGLNFKCASVASGARFTLSVRVWVPTGSPAVVIVSNFATSAASTKKDEWETLTLTLTTVSSGPLQFNVWAVTPPASGQSVYLDAALAEAGGVVGPYFDGTSPNGAWTGTAHASTSTETVSSTSVSVSLVGDGELYTAETPGDTLASVHAPVGKTIVDGLVAGLNFYDIASDGTLYEGLLSSPGTATDWPLGATPSRLGWGKHRLWIIGGRNLWQPDLSLSDGTSQPPEFVHPNKGWTYTCMAEGGSAMLFGGHDGFASTIQSITLDSGGGLPTLSGAAVTAALPDGELVQELAVIAGQFVGIGTNRGFRVGELGDGGSLVYGPLIVEPEGVTACTAVIAQGRFFLAAFRTSDGMAMAYRVDTSNQKEGGIFPYAADVECDLVGAITSMAAPTNTRLVATTSDGGVWVQSETEYVDIGVLETGRIRYRTLEPKIFKALSMDIEPLAGAIKADLIIEGGSTLTLGNITDSGKVFTSSLRIASTAMRYASVRFTLAPTEDLLEAPILHSYQVRALPAVKPQRLYTLPLLCYDKERSLSGQLYGGQGFSQDRLRALQFLEDAADVVTFQDFTGRDNTGTPVTIESIRFVQTTTDSAAKDSKPGGIVILELRTAEE